ncbi:MAG: hypothetical protein QXY76_02950 [Nitrososphaeria archaeon]
MSQVTAYGFVDNTINILEGTLEREISYTVALKVKPAAQNADYTIEKVSGEDSETGRKVYTPIQEEVDLLESSDEYRVCISENVGDNGSYIVDKCQFYRKWGIMRKIDVYIPLKIEITKLAADTPEDYVAGEASAIVELIDPPEDTSIIKGPTASGRNGADFVAFLKGQVSRGDGGDNCPNIFAPINFRDRCRNVQGDVDNIQKIIVDENKRQFRVYSENPNAVIVPVSSVEEQVEEGSNDSRKVGYAKILLHFPPIAGNNYRLKIKLINRNSQEVPLRNKQDPENQVPYVQTPTITVWKKIRIEMVALQEGIGYNEMKWNVVKSAFADAFIELEEPPTERRYTITREEWMRYLGEEVYRGWHRREWQEYSKPIHVNEHIQDFSKYSFPQRHAGILGSEKLTPPDEDPRNSNRDTWTFLEKMAKRIFREKLGRQAYNRIMDPLRGFNIGVCALICKLPFDDSTVGGLSFFNKMFYIVKTSGMEQTFSHEFGHALFLRHAPTYFVKNSDIPYTTRYEGGGSEGPFWDEHDSEDMITCIMSYADTDKWHFCGLCLLTLRLYDRKYMVEGEDSTLRRILYQKTPTVYWVESTTKETSPGVFVNWRTLHQDPPEHLMVGEALRLIALYPREDVSDNSGTYYYKDLTKHDRGSWVSTNRRVGRVNVVKRGNFWHARIKILGKGRTEIKFRLRRNQNEFDESAPLVLEVI